MLTWCEKENIDILADDREDVLQELLDRADMCRRIHVGAGVYLRGLIEFANDCECNCFYCGIRHDNQELARYTLDQDEITKLALSAYNAGFYSLALQAGQSADPSRVDFTAATIRKIKSITSSRDHNHKGLGITLSIGELSRQQYRQLFEAGAHRYLLRIETSDEKLFGKIHPPAQSFNKRRQCLEYLREEGYQVGTGIMIGLPGQTLDSLARDLKFFIDLDIDMLGMGPYLPHHLTPLYKKHYQLGYDPFIVTLKMMALARLLMPDINMVASTALQTLDKRGLELGLKAGANVVMPVLTPADQRHSYALYENKQYRAPRLLIEEINKCGYPVGLWTWGDSAHFKNKNQSRTEGFDASVKEGCYE
jgi:biotin synthase